LRWFFLCAGIDVAQKNPACASNLIMRLDINGDGKVLQSEFDCMTNIFSYLDINGDGNISNNTLSKKCCSKNKSNILTETR